MNLRQHTSALNETGHPESLSDAKVLSYDLLSNQNPKYANS